MKTRLSTIIELRTLRLTRVEEEAISQKARVDKAKAIAHQKKHAATLANEKVKTFDHDYHQTILKTALDGEDFISLLQQRETLTTRFIKQKQDLHQAKQCVTEEETVARESRRKFLTLLERKNALKERFIKQQQKHADAQDIQEQQDSTELVWARKH